MKKLFIVLLVTMCFVSCAVQNHKICDNIQPEQWLGRSEFRVLEYFGGGYTAEILGDNITIYKWERVCNVEQLQGFDQEFLTENIRISYIVLVQNSHVMGFETRVEEVQ